MSKEIERLSHRLMANAAVSVCPNQVTVLGRHMFGAIPGSVGLAGATLSLGPACSDLSGDTLQLFLPRSLPR
jgi:hypothetical protein